MPQVTSSPSYAQLLADVEKFLGKSFQELTMKYEAFVEETINANFKHVSYKHEVPDLLIYKGSKNTYAICLTNTTLVFGIDEDFMLNDSENIVLIKCRGDSLLYDWSKDLNEFHNIDCEDYEIKFHSSITVKAELPLADDAVETLKDLDKIKTQQSSSLTIAPCLI